MKKIVPVFIGCLLLCVAGSAQSILQFDINGQNNLCSNADPMPPFHVNAGTLEVYNPGSSSCNYWTVLQLQIHNFTGAGTYSLNYGSGNYGYYDNDTVPPSWSTPNYPSDPGGGSVTILQYDSALGILEGTFNATVSKHMFDTTDFTTISLTNGYFKYGTCAAVFNLEHDTVPGHWWLYYHVQGVYPLTLNFNWGDGSFTTGNASHLYAIPGNYNICLTVADNASCITTYCDSTTYVYKNESMISVDIVDPLTSISSVSTTSYFSLFPNPASNQLNISIDETLVGAQINIYNITGALVRSTQLETVNSKLETSPFANGIYIAEIKRRDVVQRVKWVKM